MIVLTPQGLHSSPGYAHQELGPCLAPCPIGKSRDLDDPILAVQPAQPSRPALACHLQDRTAVVAGPADVVQSRGGAELADRSSGSAPPGQCAATGVPT